MSDSSGTEYRVGTPRFAPAAEASDSQSPGASERILRFRRFKVLPSDRRLILGQRDVRIGGRAFDLLVALLVARGRILSKSEIMREVWPSTTVDECNLRFQMAVLRRALGRDRDAIKTIPGRGYLIIEDHDPRLDLGASPPAAARDIDVDATAAERDRWSRRLMDLEAENARLKQAISSLILGRPPLVSTIEVGAGRASAAGAS